MDLANFKEMDINILYSIVNTRLRDIYPNFDEFCQEEGLNKEEFLSYMKAHGIVYDCATKQMRPMR